MFSVQITCSSPTSHLPVCELGLPDQLLSIVSSFDLWVGKIPCRRKGQPTPVFLLEKPFGQRSLVGYSPNGCKELDTVEWLSVHAHAHTHTHTHTHTQHFPFSCLEILQYAYSHVKEYLFSSSKMEVPGGQRLCWILFSALSPLPPTVAKV